MFYLRFFAVFSPYTLINLPTFNQNSLDFFCKKKKNSLGHFLLALLKNILKNQDFFYVTPYFTQMYLLYIWHRKICISV